MIYSKYVRVFKTPHHQLIIILLTFTFFPIYFSNSVEYRKYVTLKGSVSRDFCPFFLVERFNLGPIWTGKNEYANLFVFFKDIREMCVHLVKDYSDTQEIILLWKKLKK